MCRLAVQQLVLHFHHCGVQDSHPRSASKSRPDPIPVLRPRVWVAFTHLLFKFLSQFVESRSSAGLLLPANPHQGVNTRGTVLWSLHAIAPLHSLLHLPERLHEQDEGQGQWGRRGRKWKLEFAVQIDKL